MRHEVDGLQHAVGLARGLVVGLQLDGLTRSLVAPDAQVQPCVAVLAVHLGHTAALVADKGPHLVVGIVVNHSTAETQFDVCCHVILIVGLVDRPATVLRVQDSGGDKEEDHAAEQSYST